MSEMYEIQAHLTASLKSTTPNDDPTPPDDVYWAFEATGDFIYPNFLADLENIIDSGVRVSLFYGDADYICNWDGGAAVSLAAKYAHSEKFAAAGYQPLMYRGVEYGEVREYGNFSFTRIYEAGYEVPYYQPQAALALFNRTINGVDIADGTEKVTADLESNGPSIATYTESFVTIPLSTGSAYSSYASELVQSYSVKENKPLPTSAFAA